MNPFTIFQKILDAIKANGQKQDLTNQKLDKIIALLSSRDITSLRVTVDPPVPQEK